MLRVCGEDLFQTVCGELKCAVKGELESTSNQRQVEGRSNDARILEHVDRLLNSDLHNYKIIKTSKSTLFICFAKARFYLFLV